MAFDTAGTIIADAAVELGLVSFANKASTLQDPFNSTDANIGQLCQLLKSVGRDLFRRRLWTHLQSTHTFLTTTGQALYTKPADLDGIIDNTLWNRTTRLPMGGPLNPSEREFFRARLVGVVFTLLFSELGGNFLVYPDSSTPGGYVIAYEYVSRWWVRPAATSAANPWLPSTTYATNAKVVNAGSLYTATVGGTSGTYGPSVTSGTFTDNNITWTYVSAAGTDAPTRSDDNILFEPQLVLKALIVAFKRAKGLPREDSEAELREAWEQVVDRESAAPVLSLDKGGAMQEPVLGERNVPLTGFGS